MRLRLVLSLLLLATRASATTIAVGSDTYLVESFPMPSVTDTSPLPLDITVDGRDGNTIYMVPEFDKRIYSVARTATDGTTMTQITIDGPASPLFRSPVADAGTTFSSQQERIASTSDGSIWVSQGGNVLYAGTLNDWSRIMRRRPDGVWEAYTLPVDQGGAIGFVTDDPPSRLWVMAAGANAFYFTRPRWWHEGETTATRYPPIDYRWVTVRTFGTKLRFPAQLTRIADGRFVGTLYFDSAFFIYDADSGDYRRIPLAAPPANFQLLGSSGPWQVQQHPDGSLWIAEDYAKRVTKYNLQTGAQTTFDLSALLTDDHPHSLTFSDATTSADVLVTTYSTAVGGDGRLVRITTGGVVTVGTSFATISLAGGLTGIVRDSAGALWVALFRQQKIARLTK